MFVIKLTSVWGWLNNTCLPSLAPKQCDFSSKSCAIFFHSIALLGTCGRIDYNFFFFIDTQVSEETTEETTKKEDLEGEECGQNDEDL